MDGTEVVNGTERDKGEGEEEERQRMDGQGG
jgi:hypothetical protein